MNGENTVAIGGDWDGARLPEGFSNIGDATKLAQELDRLGYDEQLIHKLFYGNAVAFIRNRLR